MTDPDPRDQVSLSLVLPLIDTCDLAGILVVGNPEVIYLLLFHALLKHFMELVRRIDKALYIEAELCPLTLINIAEGTCLITLLQRARAQAVDLDRLAVHAFAGDRVNPAIGFETVTHRCFDTDPLGVFPGRHRNRHIYISVNRGEAGVLPLRLFLEIRKVHCRCPFVVEAVCCIDLSDLFGLPAQRRICVKKAHARLFFIKTLDPGQQMFLGRHFGNKARVVLIAVDFAHHILSDDLCNRREDPAARRENISRALAPA